MPVLISMTSSLQSLLLLTISRKRYAREISREKNSFSAVLGAVSTDTVAYISSESLWCAEFLLFVQHLQLFMTFSIARVPCHLARERAA